MTLDLRFDVPPEGAFWGEGDRHCDEGLAISSWLDVSTFPSEPRNAVACPRAARGLAFTESLRPVATPAMGTVGRIPAIAKSGCPGGEDDGVIVWKSDLVPVVDGCVTLLFTGRFAKCASGDPADPAGCSTSVRCVPPPTELVALSAAGRVIKVQNISCVPPYPEPVQYAMTLRDANVREVALGLRRRGEPGGGDCFIDLYDFTAQPGCAP